LDKLRQEKTTLKEKVVGAEKKRNEVKLEMGPFQERLQQQDVVIKKIQK
jgi:uncharacterized coiled-coil DUF342 family protein